MRDKFRFNDIFRYRTAIPLMIAVGAGFWLVFSLVQETFQAVYHLRWRGAHIGQYAFTITFNFIGTVLPLLLLLLLLCRISRHRKLHGKQLSIYKVVLDELHGNTGIFLFLFILLAPFYLFLEGYVPFSVTPLVTPLCAILGITFGYYIVRHLKIRDRLTTLALLSALILGTKYIDWNPRKPLVRDMFRIEAGMTFDEVDRIMAKHKHPRGGEAYDDLKDQPEEKDEAVYMTPTTADMVTVKFQDGKVASIEFSHD